MNCKLSSSLGRAFPKSKKITQTLGIKKTSGLRWFFSYLAERRGFEPRRRLPVDSLANCSITTLAPLQKVAWVISKAATKLR
jgi:hypothetical protein